MQLLESAVPVLGAFVLVALLGDGQPGLAGERSAVRDPISRPVPPKPRDLTRRLAIGAIPPDEPGSPGSVEMAQSGRVHDSWLPPEGSEAPRCGDRFDPPAGPRATDLRSGETGIDGAREAAERGGDGFVGAAAVDGQGPQIEPRVSDFLVDRTGDGEITICGTGASVPSHKSAAIIAMRFASLIGRRRPWLDEGDRKRSWW